MMSLKIPSTHNGRVIAAAAALVLCWIIGLNLPYRADDEYLNPKPTPKKFGPSYPLRPEKSHGSALPDLVTQADEIEDFCSHFHLEPHNSTTVQEDGQIIPGPPRKVYDLMLIDPETSLDALELHLAQMAPFVDFFVLLESPSIKPPPPERPPEREWWERDLSRVTGPSSLPPSDDSDTDAQPILDGIWNTLLAPYHKKIIRRNLSQSSSDFAPGKDHPAAARNAVYSQVVPLLTGSQKAALEDVLLVSDAEELVRPDTMEVLRKCHIPKRVTIRTRAYWYSFQWFKIDKSKYPTKEKTPSKEEPRSIDKPDEKDKDASRDKEPTKDSDDSSPEWWPHPQATLYQGPETVLPNDLRKDRAEDDYVFGNGGWTCQLCYGMITNVLVKAGQQGLICFDRSEFSRIEANPDVPSYLQTNPHRFPWMLDRDPHGANFKDFDEAEFAQYLSRKKEVDAEKDTEVESGPGKVWNLASTQANNDPEFAPPDNDLYGSPGQLNDLPPLKISPPPEMSDVDKAYLKKIKGKPGSMMTVAEMALLEQLERGGDDALLPPLVYGED
ncbi:hypothetical protein INS49_014638 [Diaporthe citri]|uniref:uncharacterized protein n=1 Tax=Diaporthe citri TaxID=83186 RepID=UPI001C7EE4D1|nr:uncharacterized protein INS49_014638 [Diaporthe citri]KAG6356764.1 hypothetical protein INS49_014638 [Diaporthe citri]